MRNILKLKTSILALSVILCSTSAYADAAIVYAPTKAPQLPASETVAAEQYNYNDDKNAEVASIYEYNSGTIDYITVYNIVEENGSYYCYENGALVRDGWRMIDKRSYAQVAPVDNYNASYIWAYFTSNGKALKASSGKIKKAKFGSYTYAFNEYGQLLTGFFNEEGEMWDEDEAEDPFDLLNNSTNLYHSNELYGNLTAGWYKLKNLTSRYPNKNSIWLYFNPSSYKLTRSTSNNYKSAKIDGKTYAFDDNGVMLVGFEASQYNDEHGGSKKSVYFAADGSEVTNGFLNVDLSDDLSSEIYEEYNDTDEDITIYLSKSGKLYSNQIARIGSYHYGFDNNGVLIRGLSVWNNGNYKASINTEGTDGKAFMNSGRYVDKYGGVNTLTSTDEIHYFNPKSGKKVTSFADIDFSDGVYKYGASNSGAYEGEHSSKYYVHGLLVRPLDNVKYGVYILSPTKSDYTMAELCSVNNIVVDRNGNVQRSSAQIRDEDDNYWLLSNSSLVNVYSTAIRGSAYFKGSSRSGTETWYEFGAMDSSGRTCVTEVTPNGTRLPSGAISFYQIKLPHDAAINFTIR